MRVIVTGGAGFIGSHIVDELIATGMQVLILENFLTGRRANIQEALRAGAELIELDVLDEKAVDRVIASFRPEVIFHFAAQVDVRRSASSPAFDAQSNIIGAVNVFSAAASVGGCRVVNASTGGAIYGDAAVIPTRETAPVQPIAPYGLSKLAAETYAQWFRRARELDVLTLRFGNVYGPRQDPVRGAVVARFCDQIIHDSVLEIFGAGDATRDYLYVSDAAAAALEVSRRANLRHSIYNISSGNETSVRQLMIAVATAAGLPLDDIKMRTLPARPGEITRSCLDVSRAQNEKIITQTTALDVGINATLEWMKKIRE